VSGEGFAEVPYVTRASIVATQTALAAGEVDQETNTHLARAVEGVDYRLERVEPIDAQEQLHQCHV
jgi:hypothetical protein